MVSIPRLCDGRNELIEVTWPQEKRVLPNFGKNYLIQAENFILL